MTRPLTSVGAFHALLFLCLTACDPPAPVELDADASIDASSSLDASVDARATIDAPRPPTAREASVAFVCGHRAHAACAGRAACCEGFVPSPTCEDDVRSACEADVDPLFADLDGVAVTFDAAAFDACRAANEARADLCLEDALVEGPVPAAACFDVLEVDVAVGAACPGDWPGLGLPIRCADGRGICIGGSCVATGETEGEACTLACAHGLFCEGTACAPLRPTGGACETHDACEDGLCRGGRCGVPGALLDPCTHTAECDVGLVCTGGLCSSRTPLACDPALAGLDCGSEESCRVDDRHCGAPRVLGDRCSETSECEATAFCDGSGHCMPRPLADRPCTDLCADGLYCWLGACRLLETEGSPCYANHCAAGLGCSEDTSECIPLPARGEPCTIELACADGLGCVLGIAPDAGTCQPLLGLGAPCRDAAPCDDGLYCALDGTCSPRPVAGERCDFGTARDCASGLTCMPLSTSGGIVGEGRCVELPDAGDACFNTCAPGLACRNVADCEPEMCRVLRAGEP